VSRDPKGNPTALVVDENNKVVLRALELDRAIGDRWLVTKGLSIGDRVIVEGIERVRPGALVHAVCFDEPAGSAPKTSDSQPSVQAK
jgi:membrane fusion protein (multidrug efflux system)